LGFGLVFLGWVLEVCFVGGAVFGLSFYVIIMLLVREVHQCSDILCDPFLFDSLLEIFLVATWKSFF